MKTKDLLRDEVNSQIEGLRTEKLGTEEYDKTVNGICKMVDKLNEMEKIEIEKQRLDNESASVNIEWSKTQSENKDRKVKNIIAGAGLGLTGIGFIATLIFEERGSILSQGGRKMLDRVFRSKN